MPQQQPCVRDQVTPEEWEQRVALAAAYRLVAHFGWDDLIFTHLSARVPGGEHHFLVNPYGITFDEVTASNLVEVTASNLVEVTASNLVKVDLAGNKVMASPYAVNPAGFIIHSAIHAARDNAKCVFHVHSVNGVAVSAQKNGLIEQKPFHTVSRSCTISSKFRAARRRPRTVRIPIWS